MPASKACRIMVVMGIVRRMARGACCATAWPQAEARSPVLARIRSARFMALARWVSRWLHGVGLEIRYQDGWSQDGFQGLIPLASRRSGVSGGETMKPCGWGTRSMFDRYDVIDEVDLARAVARRLNGKQPSCRWGGTGAKFFSGIA